MKVTATEVGSGLRCPRDGALMETLVRDGLALDRCLRCGGLWIDPRVVEGARLHALVREV